MFFYFENRKSQYRNDKTFQQKFLTKRKCRISQLYMMSQCDLKLIMCALKGIRQSQIMHKVTARLLLALDLFEHSARNRKTRVNCQRSEEKISTWKINATQGHNLSPPPKNRRWYLFLRLFRLLTQVRHKLLIR